MREGEIKQALQKITRKAPAEVIGPEWMMWAAKRGPRKETYFLLPTLARLACLSSANSFVIWNLWPGHGERLRTANTLDKASAQIIETGSVPPAHARTTCLEEILVLSEETPATPKEHKSQWDPAR